MEQYIAVVIAVVVVAESSVYPSFSTVSISRSEKAGVQRLQDKSLYRKLFPCFACKVDFCPKVSPPSMSKTWYVTPKDVVSIPSKF